MVTVNELVLEAIMRTTGWDVEIASHSRINTVFGGVSDRVNGESGR